MTELILYLVLCIMLSIFFSGMETAFLSSSKLHFEMKRDNSLSAKILSTYYRNPNHFISTMLVGNSISLVMFCIGTALLIEQYFPFPSMTNNFLLIAIEIIAASFLIIITSEFIPKTIFKIFPSHTLRLFAIPAFIFYILLYPISWLVSSLSAGILRISGHKVNPKDTDKAFSKVDLDMFIQNSLKNSNDQENANTEIELSVTHWTFLILKYAIV